ncbi:MAG: hypothetical protein ABSC72_09325 [Methylovirgula sp.]|jgi:hypothetical protein
MNIRLVCAALAATALLGQFKSAQATCVIAPDHKSISVVTDNGASDEKSCSVSCKVDTKVGVLQVGCGGTTPPLAKGHSLCGFDKPDAFYNKVVSSEDSCKGDAAKAPAAVAPVAAVAPKEGFSCRISADGKTVDAMIANPYKSETSCQMDCHMSTTSAGTTISVSCAGPVAPGVGQVVLCSHAVDEGRAVKMVSGHGDCVRPLAEQTDDEKAKEKKAADDEAAKVNELMNQPMPEPSAAQKAANKANEEELEKIGDDPVKLQEYMDKKMNDAMQNATKQMK